MNVNTDSHSTVLYSAAYSPSGNDPADLTKDSLSLAALTTTEDNICVVSLIRGPTELIIQTRFHRKMIQNSSTSISERVAGSLGAN